MREFRFAILGAGKIANKFCDAVKMIENCYVTAVASKSMERAEKFAKRNEILKAYDDYERMLIEERPDCAYIAVTPDAHFKLSKLCLEHNVAVLCEKAMFLNHLQAKEVFEISHKKQLFVMEGMWSRFLPAIQKAKEWVDTNRIGELIYGRIAIGFHAPEDSRNRYFNPDLGGGVAYDLTVYCYEILTYIVGSFGEIINTAAVFGETGVDVMDQVVMRFAAADFEMLAVCESSFLAELDNRMILYGKKGRIEVPIPHRAEEAFLYEESGKCMEHYCDKVTENGFVYEIKEVRNCICSGRIESEVVPHELTLACSKLFDQIQDTR